MTSGLHLGGGAGGHSPPLCSLLPPPNFFQALHVVLYTHSSAQRLVDRYERCMCLLMWLVTGLFHRKLTLLYSSVSRALPQPSSTTSCAGITTFLPILPRNRKRKLSITPLFSLSEVYYLSVQFSRGTEASGAVWVCCERNCSNQR